MATAEEVMRSPQELFTIALESLDRQIADLQAELKQPTASIEQARGAQTVVDSPSVCENGDRRWHMAEAWRAIGQITAWERVMATHERDSGKVLDDEIKIGTFLLRLPESQLKTHLLMRVDTLKKWTDFRVKLSRFREQFLLLRRNRPQWTLELWERDSLVRMAREQQVAETQQSNAACVYEMWKHGAHVRKLPPL